MTSTIYTNNFQYDYLGRLTEILQSGASVTSKTIGYIYNLNGLRIGSTYKQEDETVSNSSWLYDVANRTTRITHRTALDSAFADYQLTWDANNNITRILSDDGQADYTYDLTGQLTGADYDFMTDENFSYDANGNDASYTIGENNEMDSDGSFYYTHDAEGNRTEKFLWTDVDSDGIVDASEKTLVQSYAWDYRNRLAGVTNYVNGVAGTTVAYGYDYLNQMITRTVGTTTETFVYDNNQVVLQFSNNTLTDINLWGANVDELVSVEKTVTNVLYWTYGDHLNTIRDVYTYNTTTETLTLENHLIYNSFGKITSSVNGSNLAINPILQNAYTGKYLDPITQLQNNLHRWYDPVTHRWLSTDPISFDGGDTNLYRYVGNAFLCCVDIYGNEKSTRNKTKELYIAASKEIQHSKTTDSISEAIQIVGEFIAGMEDSLTFGVIAAIRNTVWGEEAAKIQHNGAYIAGEVTEISIEVTLSAGSALCKKAAVKAIAKQAEKKALKKDVQVTKEIIKSAKNDLLNNVRKQARKTVGAASGEVVHHINPLLGHPPMNAKRPIKWLPGIPKNAQAMFPTLGTPWANAKSNLQVLKYPFGSEHLYKHQIAYNAERIVQNTIKYKLTATRVIVDIIRTESTFSYSSIHQESKR